MLATKESSETFHTQTATVHDIAEESFAKLHVREHIFRMCATPLQTVLVSFVAISFRDMFLARASNLMFPCFLWLRLSVFVLTLQVNLPHTPACSAIFQARANHLKEPHLISRKNDFNLATKTDFS